jgi:hypothetical protein
MLAFLIGHLVIFAPDIANRLPNWSDLLEDVPKEVVTHSGFQANLSGQLVAVPPEDYAGRSIPTIPATIEDSTGDVLSTIEYRKWQDGGIILLTGKLPLDGLLIFLPNVRPEYLRVIKRPQLQISPLLPLTRGQFDEFLKNIEGRSNKSDRPAWPSIWPGEEARHPKVGRPLSAIMPTASRLWICLSCQQSRFVCSTAY